MKKSSWNKRNGQRAEVKQPGTKAYNDDFKNKVNQFYQNGTRGACPRCNSVDVVAFVNNGKYKVYCARCKTYITEIGTSSKVGAWSERTKYLSRANLCVNCGNDSFYGKMHRSSDNRKMNLQLTCSKCGSKKSIFG